MAHRSILSVALLSLALPFNVQAEDMELTYVFYGAPAQRAWADGAVLTVNFDGTVAANYDYVTINSIESAVLTRPGLPPYEFPSISPDEIETVPAGGVPTVSFSGTFLNFTVCPSGFTTDSDGNGSLDSCEYGVDGGFGFSYGPAASDGDLAAAADDSGTAACAGASGCPVTDAPIDLSKWLLVADADNDGFLDSVDNCPDVANGLQLDTDGDGVGNVCSIGDTQSFSDGTRPLFTPTINSIDESCILNGWWVGSCVVALVEGEDGPGDNALYYDSSTSHNRHFNFMTWEEYEYSDGRFLGDLYNQDIIALRFRARHAGGTEPLVLRVMVADSFSDGGTDFAISNETATITVGSGWTDYEISLDLDDLETGTRLFGDKTILAPRRTAEEILTAVAQFSLRHDPTGAGPGTPAPTDAAMEIDDIELVSAAGSSSILMLLALLAIACRRRALPLAGNVQK